MSNDEFSGYIEYFISKKDNLNVFEKNILALAAISNKLAKMILEAQFERNNAGFRLLRGAGFDINISLNDKLLYENPILEVSNELKDFESKCALYGALFIYGLGNGVLIKALLENSNHKNIVVFEPNCEILALVFGVFDFSKELLSQRLIIANSEVFGFAHYRALTDIENIFLCSKLYNLYINKPFYEAFSDDIKRVNDMYISALKQKLNEMGNSSEDALIGVKHTTKHIPQMLKSIPLKSVIKERKNKTKTAIIVSTGPSLTKQLELLKKIQNKATIISADSGYPILKKHDIKPDYIISLERIVWTSYFFKDEVSAYDKNIIFIAPSLSHPKTLENLKNRAHSIIMRPLPYEESFKDRDFGYYGRGQSCAHLAFELATLLGHKKIIFIGQDLAYGDEFSHHADGHIWNSPTKKEEIPEAHKLTNVLSYGGEKSVQTTHTWAMFNKTFETLMATKDEKIAVYNCTEGGARINGMIEAPFKEIIETIKNEKKLKFTLPKKLSRAEQKQRLLKYKKRIDSIYNYGESLEKRIEKVFLELSKELEIATAFRLAHEYEKVDFKALENIAKKVDKIKIALKDKRFLSSYNCICLMDIKNAEIEATRILSLPNDPKEKLIFWLNKQRDLLFKIAGYITAFNDELKANTQDWN